MKIKKFFFYFSYLPAVVLLIGIFVPFVANFFISNTALLDNRTLYQKPTHFSASYFKEWEDYYNDTFAGRRKLIRKYSKLRKKLGFSGSAFFMGEDGRSFLKIEPSGFSSHRVPFSSFFSSSHIRISSIFLHLS